MSTTELRPDLPRPTFRLDLEPPAPAPRASIPPAHALELADRLHDLLPIACRPLPALALMRVDQMLHGHTPAADMARSPYELARRTAERLQAVTDRLMGHPDPARLRLARRSLEAAGGMVMALHDRISAELERGPEAAE